MSEVQNKKVAIEKEQESFDWTALLMKTGTFVAQGFLAGFISACGARAFQLITQSNSNEGNNVISLDSRKAI